MGKTVIQRDLSSIKVTKYTAPPLDGTGNGPATLVCTRSKRPLAQVVETRGIEVRCIFPAMHASQTREDKLLVEIFMPVATLFFALLRTPALWTCPRRSCQTCRIAALVRTYAAVTRASAQNSVGMFFCLSIARMKSFNVRFIVSATPFCCGVYAHVCW